MSSNPEQIPKSSESNVPHSGEYVSPNALPIEEGIPAPDTAFAGFDELPPQDHERSALDQGKAAVRDSHATETKPDKKNVLRRVIMVSSAVGATAVAGVLVAASIFTGNAKEGNNNANTLPPAPETTNSAPGVPVPAPEITKVAPSATNTPERTQGAVVIKFFDETGAEVSKEELSKSVKLTTDKYPTGTAALGGFFENMETMMNHTPSDDEIRNNLGYPADKELTKEDYLAAHRIYRHAGFDDLYTTTSGPLYSSMDKLAESTAENTYDTRNEADPYRISFEPNELTVLVLDNSTKNSVGDVTKTFEFMVDGGYGIEKSIGTNGEKPAWLIPGNANFTLVN